MGKIAGDRRRRHPIRGARSATKRYYSNVRNILLALVFYLAAGADLTAQSVRGVVFEENTETPIAGAMVVLIDVNEGPVDRALTNVAGDFQTSADHPGRYRIRVDRIGYASLTTDTFDVGVQGAVRRIEVPIEPVRLRGLDVSGGRRCEVRPEDGRVTARVWAEARKSLEAAAWTQSTGVYRYTLLHYVRDLDRDGERIMKEEREFIRGSVEAPFQSLRGDELAARGFVYTQPDSGTFYYAPDAEAFLSDAFLDTHCLQLRSVRDGSLGLGFQPIEGRALPEIEGVLWLNLETAVLERLEFSYVNVPGIRNLDGPGGEVSFTRLPDGTWIVRDWWIRMPLLDRVLGQVRRVGYRDEGGVAWRVTDRTGTTVLEASTATITGSVMDSIRMVPVEDVTVRVGGTGEVGDPRPDGSFLLPGLAGGLHRLVVRHALLDTLGLPAPAVLVNTVLGEMVHVTLRVPTLADALSVVCGPARRQTSPLLGRVVGPDGLPRAEASVKLGWLAETRFAPNRIAIPAGPDGHAEKEWTFVQEGEFMTVQTQTDPRGIFLLCGVPHGSSLRLDVWIGDGLPQSSSPVVQAGAGVALIIVEIDEGR